MFRDDAWATSPLQPTVICTTVDQLGSRLLFRGYGVSPHSAAIHAGLAANDALILLDEAHCAEPFRQTLEAVRLFRDEKWAEQPLRSPFAFVQMSATPRSDAKPFVLDGEDREHAEFKRRLSATKRALLVESQYETATDAFARELAALAHVLANQGSRRIAVLVNRVDTAKTVLAALQAQAGDPEDINLAEGAVKALMIGRMRPLDRDDLTRRWQPYLRATSDRFERPRPSTGDPRPLFVVATQCLEVGANLDFDALITEAASLDALRQRFGRLNRLGRDKRCSAVIVAPKDAVTKDADDAIYGPAIAKTWAWLQKHAQAEAADDAQAAAAGDAYAAASKTRKKKNAATGAAMDTIDFGIAAMDKIIAADQPGRECFAPAPDAPVMLPAHLDLWCQTTPIPDPDPDVSIFLHGPQRGVPTVSVCWRADLADDRRDDWDEIVSLLPPSSPECMPVPLHLVRRWMQYKSPEAVEDTGDVEEAAARVDDDDDRHENNGEARYVLRWRGRSRDDHSETRATNDPHDVRPGDVVVIPAVQAPTCTFGHLAGVTASKSLSVEACAELDRAEQANLIARRRLSLRLAPQLVESWPDPRDEDNRPVLPARADLMSLLGNSETRERLGEADVAERLRGILRELGRQLKDAAKAGWIGREWAWLRILVAATTIRSLRTEVVDHPGGGIVIRGRRRIGERALRAAGFTPGGIEADFGDESESTFGMPRPVPLGDHVSGVAARARAFAYACGTEALVGAIRRAAELHDHGKLDPRFQAFMLGVGCRSVNGRPPLAKSGRSPTPGQMREDTRRAGLPPGFRHEMLSMQIAEHAQCEDGRPLLNGLRDELRDLVLHLIASHHGHARPLAPVVIDESPQPLPGFDLETDGKGDGRLVLPATDASGRADWEKLPAHRLDSGVCDRFWMLTRRYGWWGLAYLEAILRLADRAISREEREAAR